VSGVDLPDKLYFRIGEAAQLVGVEPHVLRYWESEFRMRPQRSASGQRMYRRKDITKFLRIRKLLHEEGFTIAGARKAFTEGTPQVGPSVDPARLTEAISRIKGVRSKIASVRARVRHIGVGADIAGAATDG